MKTSTTNLDEEIKALVQLRDEDIDTSEIPEVTDWSEAVVGKFYRPVKQPVTLRLDADIVAWLKSNGPGYQTRINALLRTSMTERVGNVDLCDARELRVAAEPEPYVGFQFPSLEEKRHLARYSQIAQVIKNRGSLFARAA